MRVYLGSDHAGFELKNHLVEWLKANNHEVTDCGNGATALEAAHRSPPDLLMARQPWQLRCGSRHWPIRCE